MKFNHRLFSIFLFAVTSALASSGLAWADPILSKVWTSGMTSNGFGGTLYECKIFADRMEIVRAVGELRTTATQTIKIEGDLGAWIANAETGTITKSRGPFDKDSLAYTVGTMNEDGTWRRIPLKSDGGVVITNDAKQVNNLVYLIDSLCGRNYR